FDGVFGHSHIELRQFDWQWKTLIQRDCLLDTFLACAVRLKYHDHLVDLIIHTASYRVCGGSWIWRRADDYLIAANFGICTVEYSIPIDVVEDSYGGGISHCGTFRTVNRNGSLDICACRSCGKSSYLVHGSANGDNSLVVLTFRL